MHRKRITSVCTCLEYRENVDTTRFFSLLLCLCSLSFCYRSLVLCFCSLRYGCCSLLFHYLSLLVGFHIEPVCEHGYAATREAAMVAFAKSWRGE